MPTLIRVDHTLMDRLLYEPNHAKVNSNSPGRVISAPCCVLISSPRVLSHLITANSPLSLSPTLF